MTKRFRPSQDEKIRKQFGNHPYFMLADTVFRVFQELCPTMVTSPEQLFADAAFELDSILTDGKDSVTLCKSLWTRTYNEYRARDNAYTDPKSTTTEVAMLFYMMIFGVNLVDHSHYRGTLQRTLHDVVWKLYGPDECRNAESRLEYAVNVHTRPLYDWMKDYFVSKETLTQELESTIRPPKTARRKEEKKKPVFHTLCYTCTDRNLRTKRIDLVRRKWEEWEWIKPNTDVDDFDNFFKDTPRDCQLTWTCSNAVLSILIGKLLKQEELFQRPAGCSASSIVKYQFQKTYDNHSETVDPINLKRIDWTIILLNYKKPLELPQLPCHQGDDISDAALQEVFTGQMHITKDLNKYQY